MLRTTGAQRTGGSMCGFGIHMEKRAHRFDKLRERNPKEWEFWMYRCCIDKETDEKLGWGEVFNFGVAWEDNWNGIPEDKLQIPGQMKLSDYLEKDNEN
uniref:hypothetical protein n=1 Tax=Clostridium sp. NkU-1 TaxID=1095009 RepID=UPI00326037BD